MNSKINETKRLLRKDLTNRIAMLTVEDQLLQAQSVFTQIEQLDRFKKANSIGMYWSMKGELPTHEFVNQWSLSKKIFLPQINGVDMIFRRFTNSNELVREDKFGIFESTGEIESQLDLLIVPSLAFDHNGNRLGKGKGFYDRYLVDHPKIHTIGVGFNIQLVASVPIERFDIPMNEVVCA